MVQNTSDLDQFDQAILATLAQDGRISITDLSKRIGLSKSPTQARLRRLEDSGVILGYRAMLNPIRLGLDHVAFVEVRLTDTREAALAAFNAAVSKVPQIEQAHMIAGNFDYLLKVRTRDMNDYRSFLGDTISALPHVASTSTYVAMEAVKEVMLSEGLDPRTLCAIVYPMRSLFALAVMVGPVFTSTAVAQECSAAPDVAAELEQLFVQAQGAQDVRQGQAASDAMWKVWLRAPDEAAQAVLDRGMAARSSYNFVEAYAQFTRLTEYCPDYAEGWNQRAYISFLREDYAGALTDLDRALVLQPRHVAAQSGRGLTLMHLGRTAQARAQMLEAVANNPWLSEKALLAKGAPLGPAGEDI